MDNYDKINVTYSQRFNNYALLSTSDEYREYLELQSKGEALKVDTRTATGPFKTEFQGALETIYNAKKAS